LTAPVNELACIDLPARCVIVVENIQSGVAFPDLEETVVLMGMGYDIAPPQDLPWVKLADVLYWGDIDTHGLAILSHARDYLPGIQSLMMNQETLLLNWELCVEEKPQHGAETLPNLTEEELALYAGLKRKKCGFGLRLEQERISWTDAWTSIKGAHESLIQKRR
jgi:hypothetical protein